ncbi:MAG: glycoside hydrolase family 36 protein [Gemmatimonadota bacterium]
MIRSLLFLILLAGLPVSLAAQTGSEPPNRPALMSGSDSTVALQYQDALLLDAHIRGPDHGVIQSQLVDSTGGRITQVLKWTVRGGTLTLTAIVQTSVEGFAAAAEPREDGLLVVRHAVGPVVNRLNRAVYDRHDDWVLSVDEPARVEIVPLDSATGHRRFRLTASGGEVSIRFRPRFYQKHRGLSQYRPWTYRPWPLSVAGWSSWYAFFDKVTEADIERTADILGAVLQPFGYRYLQIDDGYQRLPIGLPQHWLESNDKFPGGLAHLREYISARGLEPGLWTNVSFQDDTAAAAHPRWFLAGADGRPAWGRWVGYVMDGSAPGVIDSLIRPVYHGLRAMGWTYVKLDALRDLRYEGYNSYASDFARRGLDREAVFRSVVQEVRQTLGPDIYLLACWGIRPELIGLVDAVRVGDDGFGYGSFAQYNSFNNVVWRNDPDHIELHQPDGFRATTVTSLTGSVLMLTDQPEIYRTDRAEAAKRTAPVLFTRPGQLYDVDPSRSSLLAQVATELSGSGPRAFDADQREVVTLYQLDIARPFEQWTVLARTGGDQRAIPFAELGLPAATDYLAFEFWTRHPLGVVRDSLVPGPIDPGFQVQVFCLRPRVDHPQVLSSSRHVTCGGPDLSDVAWHGDTLSGVSRLVANDPYDLFLTEPAGYRLAGVEATGARVTRQPVEGGTRIVRLESQGGGEVRWRISYRRQGS